MFFLASPLCNTGSTNLAKEACQFPTDINSLASCGVREVVKVRSRGIRENKCITVRSASISSAGYMLISSSLLCGLDVLKGYILSEPAKSTFEDAEAAYIANELGRNRCALVVSNVVENSARSSKVGFGAKFHGNTVACLQLFSGKGGGNANESEDGSGDEFHCGVVASSNDWFCEARFG